MDFDREWWTGSVMTRSSTRRVGRQAADLDYGLTVLSDACSDPDPEVHHVLMDKVFPCQSQVVTADEWLATL
jgi:nicotinamidase-related amidase